MLPEDNFDEDEVHHFLYYHLIMAVAYQQAVIEAGWAYALQLELEAFMERQQCESLRVALLPDHMHLLFRGHPDMVLDSFIAKLKDHLAHWIQEHRPTQPAFAWQEGYACFSVGGGDTLEEEREYIANQSEFHRQVDFLEEFPMLLEAQGIAYNPDDLFQPLQ